MEGANANAEQDEYDQSFIEVPAIIDKHKAAAEVCQGKYLFPTTTISIPQSIAK